MHRIETCEREEKQKKTGGPEFLKKARAGGEAQGLRGKRREGRPGGEARGRGPGGHARGARAGGEARGEARRAGAEARRGET